MDRPCPSARRSPRWGRRATPFGFALAEALNSLYKAELIRNQGPWEDIDAARAHHRRVGALVQHRSPSLRHRHAHPRRARSRLGPRPPPPRTITTGNHRHQINQPPQNPGLDSRHTDFQSPGDQGRVGTNHPGDGGLQDAVELGEQLLGQAVPQPGSGSGARTGTPPRTLVPNTGRSGFSAKMASHRPTTSHRGILVLLFVMAVCFLVGLA